jgi:aspartyl-tRNA(Asn)/glutamyl-tRNA(Gln) amidotransferase subunit C
MPVATPRDPGRTQRQGTRLIDVRQREDVPRPAGRSATQSNEEHGAMSVDDAAVDHVAALARLALSSAERAQLRNQLSAILEHINVIAEADTSQVPATASVLPLENVTRGDDPQPWTETEALVERAPAHEDSYLRVRAVLDQDE